MTLADSATVEHGLAEAVRLHTAGELDAAASAYELLIARMAAEWEPRFLLGLVRFQQSNFASAQRWLLETTRLNASHADAWYYLGASLAGQGQIREAEAAYAKAGTPFSPHAMASFKLAQLLESRGALSDAREAYRAALAGNVDFPEALNNLGLLLRNSGAADEAEALLRRALQLRPDFAQAYINLAGLLTERGGEAQASVAVLQTAIQTCSASAELHFHLAGLQARSGAREAAVASYEQVLAIDADHAEAYNNVGVLFLEEGFLDEARVCFERATTLKPQSVEASNNLTNLLTERAKHDASRAASEETLTIKADVAGVCAGCGSALNERSTAQQAVERVRAVVERRASYADVGELGAALQRLRNLNADRSDRDVSPESATDEISEAIRSFEQARQAQPDVADAYFKLAAVYERQGRRSDALATLRDACGRFPNAVAAHERLAVLSEPAGFLEEAIQARRRVVSLQPLQFDSWMQLSELCLRSGLAVEADIAAREALGIRPDSAAALCQLGEALTKQKRFEEAAAAITKAITVDPASPRAHHALGVVLTGQERLQDAAASFRVALQLEPAAVLSTFALGALLQRMGEMDAARALYESIAGMASNSPGMLLRRGLMLPPGAAPGSISDAALARFERDLDALFACPPGLAQSEVLQHLDMGFFDHAANHRAGALGEKVGLMLRATCPDLVYMAAHTILPRTGATIRLGFVARDLDDTTAASGFDALIEYCAQQPDLEVHLFCIDEHQSPQIERLAELCDNLHWLSGESLAYAHEKIAERELDVLIYSDIGREPFTYLLGQAKLARVQCLFLRGNAAPGLPYIDHLAPSARGESAQVASLETATPKQAQTEPNWTPCTYDKLLRDAVREWRPPADALACESNAGQSSAAGAPIGCDLDRIGFLMHGPGQIAHYQSIWRHLPKASIEIVNVGQGEDVARIDAIARDEGLSCVSGAYRLAQRQRYRCLVSNHPVDFGYTPIIKRLAHRNVRLMYGQGKIAWNFLPWNAWYDAVLCFGPQHAEQLAAFPAVRAIQVGYPRFDAFFHLLADRQRIAAGFGCDPSRKTIVWLPTWGALSSVGRFDAAIASLSDRYNVLVKLHPLMASSDPAKVQALQRLGFTCLVTDHSDSLPFYVAADFLLCDYGGPLFGGLYTDRNVMLLNVPNAENDELTGPQSPDILVRAVLPNVDSDQASHIATYLDDSSIWAQQVAVRRELRRAFFAPHYGYASQVAAQALQHIDALCTLG